MPSESGRNEDNFSLEGTNHSVQIIVGNLALDLRLSPIFDPSADQEPLPRSSQQPSLLQLQQEHPRRQDIR